MGQIHYTQCEIEPTKDQFETKKAAARRLQQIVRKAKIHGHADDRPDHWYKCKDRDGMKGCGYYHLETRGRKKSAKARRRLQEEGILRAPGQRVLNLLGEGV